MKLKKKGNPISRLIFSDILKFFALVANTPAGGENAACVYRVFIPLGVYPPFLLEDQRGTMPDYRYKIDERCVQS
jgi:hypothetical protein